MANKFSRSRPAGHKVPFLSVLGTALTAVTVVALAAASAAAADGGAHNFNSDFRVASSQPVATFTLSSQSNVAGLIAAHRLAATELEQLIIASQGRVEAPAVLLNATADLAEQGHIVARARFASQSIVQLLDTASLEKNSTVNRVSLSVSAATAKLAADSASIRSAVSAWQRDQTAAAATAAAAEASAAAAASAAIVPVTPSVPVIHSVPARSAPQAVPTSSANNITVNVRTTVNAGGGENGQAAINAGGQVAVIWSNYGAIVSAHNTSDARALSLKPGDTVTFTGAVQGRYRVSGSIDVSQGASVSSVAQLGTTMMMQTCYFNSNVMRVVGMEPA